MGIIINQQISDRLWHPTSPPVNRYGTKRKSKGKLLNGFHRFVTAQTIVILAITLGRAKASITRTLGIFYIKAHSPSGKMGGANIIHLRGSTRLRSPWVSTRWHGKFIVRFLTNCRTGLSYRFNPHDIGCRNG